MKVFGGRVKCWVYGFGELRKIGEVKGEGVKSVNKTKSLIT